MDLDQLKEALIAKSKELGIDKVGFASAEPFEAFLPGMQEAQAKGYTTGFEHKVLEDRIYPNRLMDQPQSIIAIALAYPSLPSQPIERVKGERRGAFARASWGLDYHHILQEKLQALVAFLQEAADQVYDYKPMVDTGELIDVRVAERAGLGFVGKNGLLITKEFGSYVYLGEILTSIPFAPDERVDYDCGECRRCLDFCPPGALLGDGKMNGRRCLSYQTQTKGFMPHEFRRQIGHVIYGCDICQQVCPYNKGKNVHHHPAMEPDIDSSHPKLLPLLTISNQEFKARFGHMAGAWRGKKPIQRNAIIALANYKDRTAIPSLLQLMEEDPRPVIRGTAAWAIATIVPQANSSLLAFFRERIQVERDLGADSDLLQELAKAWELLESKGGISID